MNDEFLNQILKEVDPAATFLINDESLQVLSQSILRTCEDGEGTWVRKFLQNANAKTKAIVGGVFAFLVLSLSAGTTLVARNLLNDSWRQSIDDMNCDVSSNNAREVRSGIDSVGARVEYWVVKSDKSVVDIIIQHGTIDGSSGGTTSCDHKPRENLKPFIAASFYAGNDKVPHASFYGWVPPGSTGIVEMENGQKVSVQPDSDGNILTLVDLQEPSLEMRQLEIIDATGKVLQVLSLRPAEE